MQKRKGLGRGLSSIAESAVDVQVQRRVEPIWKVLQLRIDDIESSPFQPRSVVDEESLMALSTSIKELGVIEPIVVRQLGLKKYQLVAGQRRLLAAKKAGLIEVPAIVLELSDQEAVVFSLVENLQREDLNPLDEAESYSQLINQFHFTHQRIAELIGKSRVYITNTLRLLSLPQDALEAIRKGLMTRGQGIALLAIPPNERAMVLERVLKEGLKVREIENLAIELGKTVRKPPRKQKALSDTPYLTNLAQQMEIFLGTRVRIKSFGKSGKIEVTYSSLDDLNRIVRLILPEENPF